jgi:hypothetical protein
MSAARTITPAGSVEPVGRRRHPDPAGMADLGSDQ